MRKGQLTMGTAEEPLENDVTVTLYGDRADKDIHFNDNMFEGGNKAIAVTGTLRMFGKPVNTKWTRLASPIAAGNTTFNVTASDISDWKTGDVLGIAPSGRDWQQRDKCVIANISSSTITCNQSMTYAHYGAATHDPSESGDIDIRAEVVHLTRNLKVKGEDKDRWGGQIVTGNTLDTVLIAGVPQSVNLIGDTIIDNVEFYNCSQYDTDKAGVRFDNLNIATTSEYARNSSITNSTFHDGHGIGIMVKNSENVTVDSNVLFYQHIGGIWLRRSDNVTITNNVVAGMGTRYWSNNGDTRLDEIAGYNLCNDDHDCRLLKVQNNIMAGGERIGFAIPTVACNDVSSYSNNLAHSVQHGAWVFKNTLLSGCEAFNNFKAYKTREQGVLMYQGYQQQIEAQNIETYDCGRGVTLNLAGKEFNYIHLKDSVIWGESNVLPQDEGSFCIDIFGYWLSAASNSGKVVPEVKLSKLPYEKIKSDASWFTEGYGQNVTFKNWKSGTREN